MALVGTWQPAKVKPPQNQSVRGFRWNNSFWQDMPWPKWRDKQLLEANIDSTFLVCSSLHFYFCSAGHLTSSSQACDTGVMVKKEM